MDIVTNKCELMTSWYIGRCRFVRILKLIRQVKVQVWFSARNYVPAVLQSGTKQPTEKSVNKCSVGKFAEEKQKLTDNFSSIVVGKLFIVECPYIVHVAVLLGLQWIAKIVNFKRAVNDLIWS